MRHILMIRYCPAKCSFSPHDLLKAKLLVAWSIECIDHTLSVMKVYRHEVMQGFRASCLIQYHLLQYLCTSIAHSCTM